MMRRRDGCSHAIKRPFFAGEGGTPTLQWKVRYFQNAKEARFSRHPSIQSRNNGPPYPVKTPKTKGGFLGFRKYIASSEKNENLQCIAVDICTQCGTVAWPIHSVTRFCCMSCWNFLYQNSPKLSNKLQNVAKETVRVNVSRVTKPCHWAYNFKP